MLQDALRVLKRSEVLCSELILKYTALVPFHSFSAFLHYFWPKGSLLVVFGGFCDVSPDASKASDAKRFALFAAGRSFRVM